MPIQIKKLLPILALVFAFCKSPSKKADESQYADLTPVYDRVLSTLDNWTSSKKVKKDNVEETVQFALRAITAGKLGIAIRPDLPPNFFEGAQFFFDSVEKKPYIAVNPYILRSFDSYPTIMLSAMVHEMQHAQSYLNDPVTFASVEGNLLERYLYELDAYHIEAKFILRYLANNPRYQITPFEKLLSRSFSENYLEEFSAKLLGHDMHLAMAIAEKYRKPQTEQEMIADIQKLLSGLEKTQFDTADDKYRTYLKLMPLYTINQFLPFGLRYIYFKFRPAADPASFDFKQAYPEVFASYVRLAQILESRRSAFFSVASETREKYTQLQPGGK